MTLPGQSSFRLALVQMRLVGGDTHANVQHACEQIGLAARHGASVVLLPEALPLGWTHSSALTLAEEIPEGTFCQRLIQAAQEHRVWICSGIIERAGDQIFNSAVLVSPTGTVLARHRKLNELALGHELYAQGDRLQVVPTPMGTLGVMICADAFAPGQIISRALGYMGADVILSPCAWAVPADHDNKLEPYGRLWLENYGPVARDFQIWIAGASNVGWLTDGPWQGRKCIGCSLVVAPTGQAVLQGPYGVDAEAILYTDIKPVVRPARGDQWAQRWTAPSDKPVS